MRLRNPFGRGRKETPAELWTPCPSCGEMLFNKQLARNLSVCMKCEHHFRISARRRIELLVDKGSFDELDALLASADPLGFNDSKPYGERIAAAQGKSGEKDAVVTGRAAIGGAPVVIAVMEFEFIGGSMGSVVGEKLARAAELAALEQRALVIVSSSGGARMQEGAIALMQMAKVTVALSRLAEAGMPYISVLADPTTGGVLASFASIGDVILAEPNALLGFSGARVTAGTIGEQLPKGFQRSEFVLAHGFLDQVVPRAQLRDRLAYFIDALRPASREGHWSL